jgi:hypothetical protein
MYLPVDVVHIADFLDIYSDPIDYQVLDLVDLQAFVDLAIAVVHSVVDIVHDIVQDYLANHLLHLHL